GLLLDGLNRLGDRFGAFTRPCSRYEGSELIELPEYRAVDTSWMLLQKLPSPISYLEVRAPSLSQRARLIDVSSRPMRPFREDCLFATWQQLFSFLVGQLKLMRELGDAIADVLLLPVRCTFEKRSHQRLIVWDGHLLSRFFESSCAHGQIT